MKISTQAILLFVFLFGLLGCNKNIQQLNPIENRVLNKAEYFHGGAERFRSIQNITYTKRFTLYLEDGTEEKTFTQYHDYDFDKEAYKIKTLTGNDTFVLTSYQGQITKLKNGSSTNTTASKLLKELNTSLYVFRIPFNLRDPGVQLDLLDTDQEGKNTFHVLSAIYNPDKHSNHSTSDRWFFRISEDSGEVISNKIYSSDHKSWVDNLSWHEVDGMRFYHHRKSYRLDQDDQKTYLRAEYWYEDFKINAN